MEDKLLKIINNYGVLNQLKYFQSEVYELTEAILDYEYTEKWGIEEFEQKLKEHIAEELADCYVMLSQFQFYYDIEVGKTSEIMRTKVERQLERMKEE